MGSQITFCRPKGVVRAWSKQTIFNFEMYIPTYIIVDSENDLFFKFAKQFFKIHGKILRKIRI